MLKLLQRAKNKKGFTLIELIVVIAILAILAAILIPSMMSIVGDARTTVKNANAQTLYSAAQSAYVTLSLVNDTTPEEGTYNSTDTTNAFIVKINDNLGAGITGDYSVVVNSTGVTSVTMNGVTYTPSAISSSTMSSIAATSK